MQGTQQAPARDRFYANGALILLALVLANFPITYFAALAMGTGRFSVMLHLHAASCFGWVALYCWQTHLVATGRVARHREWGLAGIALSALILPLGAMTMVGSTRKRIAAGHPHPFDFSLFNVVDLTLFAVLTTLAIAAVTRHRDWHRRFMLGAAVCLLGPALSRGLFLLPAVPPWTDLLPNLTADLFVIAMMLHDRRLMGRVHRATWVTAALLIPLHLATPFLTTSDLWRAIGPGIMRLAV